MLQQLDLPAGSMGPKVEAICEFAETTGHFAGIGALTDAEAILKRTGRNFHRTGGLPGPVEARDGCGPKGIPAMNHGHEHVSHAEANKPLQSTKLFMIFEVNLTSVHEPK